MIVSIFKDLTFVTGVDYSYTPSKDEIPEIKDEEGVITQEFVPAIQESGNPYCVACIEVDFNPSIETLEIIEKKGKYSANIIPIPPPPETPEDRKARIISLLISSEDYKSVDSEGVFLEYSDIGSAIIARFFKGDPNAEMAYLQKWNFLTSLPERTEEQQSELDLIKKGYVAKEEFKDFLLSLINK